jgi:hypothetical protein
MDNASPGKEFQLDCVYCLKGARFAVRARLDQTVPHLRLCLVEHSEAKPNTVVQSLSPTAPGWTVEARYSVSSFPLQTPDRDSWY